MQVNNQQIDFQIYGPRVFTFLSAAMILKNNHFTKCRKLSSSFITGSCLVMGLSLITSEILDIKNIHDLQSLAERINPICFHSLGVSKWIIAIMKFDDLQILIHMIKNSHQHCLQIDDSDKDYKRYKQKIKEFKKEMSLFALVWLCICSGGIIQWCSTPIIYDFHNGFNAGKNINASSRHLPYPGIFPWDINTNTKYIATFAFQLISGYQTSMGHAIFEILFLTILSVGCMHLEYLNECLTNKKGHSLDPSDKYGLERFYRKIRHCMIHHQSILEYLQKCNSIFNIPIFILCITCTLSLCLVSLEASSINLEPNMECFMKLLSMMEYWMGIIVSLFLYCYMAAKLETLGLKIADSFYNCEWELSHVSGFDVRSRRVSRKISDNVKICIMQAQKPIVVNGGAFYILSLPTFKAVVGFALSNAVVLRQLSADN